MKQTSIPVLYYHRVGAPDPTYLSISCRDFEKQLRYLKKAGYRTISIKELLEILQGRAFPHERAVCLTFDDGFIDNLLYAQPLLEKYGFRAALFVATSLLRPENQAPATEMTDFNSAHTLARRGDFSHFLSEGELQKMAASGTWEILSHSHFHNQVFISDEVTGTYPDSDNHWGILSAWQRGLEKGRWPVFKRGAGLVNPAWLPVIADLDVTTEIDSTRVKFDRETDEAWQARVEEDLRHSLQIIKRISSDSAPVICWPWGKTSPRLEEIAARVGYIGALRTDTGPNEAGMNLMQIHRFAIKKADLLRFKLGLLLRNHRSFAKIYSLLRK